MTKVMRGVRVLEVAQFTFVPAAGAVLADWGADVIKIEHPVRGDTQRGFLDIEACPVDPERNILIEHPNRGKRSVGIDLSKPEGQALIHELAASCDVFLTNYLPAVRRKFRIDVEDIRAHNKRIIYARGSAFGDKGPDREKGGFDSTAFWARAGSSSAVTPPELGGPLTQPTPAYGDTIGAMNIAGGISAALFHRERTGEAVELDVSLLSSGVWAAAVGIDMAMEMNRIPFHNRMPKSGSLRGNPFMGVFRTADNAYLNLTILTPGPLIRDTFEHLGRPELADDPRFSTLESLTANWVDGSAIVADAIGRHDLAYWRERFTSLKGQWAAYQSLLDVGKDPQVAANDLILEVDTGKGTPPIKLISNPVQFDHAKVETTRAPERSEHTDVVLGEAGFDPARLQQLRDLGVIS